MLRPNFRSSFWGSSLGAQVLNLKFWLNFFLHASFESKFWLKFMRSSFELKFLCSCFEPQVLAQFFALNFWVQVLAHKFWLTSWAERRGGVVIEDQCAERSEAEWRRAHWLPRITTSRASKRGTKDNEKISVNLAKFVPSKILCAMKSYFKIPKLSDSLAKTQLH